jgi:hypothetical protein
MDRASNGPTEAVKLLVEKDPLHRPRLPPLRPLETLTTALRNRLATHSPHGSVGADPGSWRSALLGSVPSRQLPY